MQPVDLRDRLSALDPAKLERLMQLVVKHHVERDPDPGGAAVFQSGEILSAGLGQAAADAGLVTGVIAEPADKVEALRAILLQLADEPGYAESLRNALPVVERDTRLDPFTASIVLAGIVLVLQTRFEIRYDDDNGKKKLHIEISKAPTSETLLTKFFGLFK